MTTETITQTGAPLLATERIRLVVLDMAGTTVLDDGVVERAFAAAAEQTGLPISGTWDTALEHVRATMGQSKIDVFTVLADGDADLAGHATAAFEAAYANIAAAEGAEEVSGAGEIIRQLRAAGRSVWLTTGFSPITRDDLLARLPWGAGAGLVVGVLSGAHDRAALEAAGADAVLADLTELPALLQRLGR